MKVTVNPERSGPIQPGKAPAAPREPEPSLSGYLLSLPERVVRSAAGVSAGLVRELSDFVLPDTIRGTKLYENLVAVTLRFLIEDVGGVEGAYPSETRLSHDFALRRATGNGLELLGIIAFRASPVWVLAALADITGAGRKLIPEISGALKAEGLLPQDEQFSTLDQMLDGLEQTSARLAQAVNTPPLDVASLRKELNEIREHARKIPPSRLPSAEHVRDQWRRLNEESVRQNRSVFQLSTAMALAAITGIPEHLRWLSRSITVATRRTGEVVAETLMEHYSKTLGEIRETGFAAYWVEQFRPYLAGAAQRFSRETPSLTERFLRRRDSKNSG